ncbi:hypothetical protein HDV00_012618, partial [Rhizophlyctis rosea]
MASGMEETLATESEKARREIEESLSERAKLLADRDAAQREAHQLKLEVKRIREERDTVVAERQATQQETRRLQSELNNARAEQNSILSSLTAQFRRTKTDAQDAVTGKEREVKRLVGMVEGIEGGQNGLAQGVGYVETEGSEFKE